MHYLIYFMTPCHIISGFKYKNAANNKSSVKKVHDSIRY